MPTRSPRDVPARTIHELRLPGRAVRALTRAGVTRVDDLAVLTRRELAAINGLGPGMIAAIRLVVPEPPTSAARTGTTTVAGRGEPTAAGAIDPGSGPAEEESPAAPAIPSFDSLRASPRRTAVDLLVPGAPPAAAPSATVPRPAEYADLLRLAVRLGRTLASVPARLAWWSVREPVRRLRWLLGQ